MAHHVIACRVSFSVIHGRKAEIATPDQMSPISQGPVTCHQALWKKLGKKWLNYSKKDSTEV
jgi:hypothetical protein